MKVLVGNNDNDVVIDIVDSAEEVSNGLQVNRDGDIYIYASSIALTVENVETIPEGVMAQKYKYIEGEFVLNPDYVEPEE